MLRVPGGEPNELYIEPEDVSFIEYHDLLNVPGEVYDYKLKLYFQNGKELDIGFRDGVTAKTFLTRVLKEKEKLMNQKYERINIQQLIKDL